MKAKLALAFAIVYVVWGSTYLAIRIGLQSMPPLTMAGVRFLVAGLILWAWSELRREARPTREQFLNSAAVGLGFVVVGNGFVTYAEKTVPSSLTALLVALSPAFTVALGWARGDLKRPTVWTVGGLALGLLGVGFLVTGSGGGRIDPLGVVLILIANLGWSWGILHSQASTMPTSASRATAIQMLTGGGVMLVAGLALGERLRPSSVEPASWWALAYLVVFGAIGAYTAYGWLLRHVSVTAVGTTAYVNPAVAVLLGALWGEPVGGGAVVAMTLILAGVWMMKRHPAPAKRACEA